MTKILVKKSVPKGVLVKQVQPQLMQTPDRGKGFMDFFNTFRNKDKNPNIGVKQRLAGLAGMAGKVGAGLSTVNDTMQAMQGGNISAPLGMGYTFEAKDPTGRMISEAANPSQPKPEPTVQANLPKTSLGRGGNLPANIRQQVDERKERERLLAQMANPAPGSAMDQMNQRRNQLQAQDSQRNEIFTQNLPQITPELQARQQAHYNSVLQNMPTPASPPIPPQPPLTVNPLDTMRTSTEVPPNMPPIPPTAAPVQQPPTSFTVSPNQPVSYTGNLPQPTAITNPYANVNPQIGSMVQNLTSGGMTGQGPVNPNNQQAMISASQNMARQSVQSNQPAPVAPQPAGPPQGYQYTVGQFAANNPPQSQNANVPSTLSAQEEYMKNLMGDPDAVKLSFVTALTEKLGADIVYKMSPHEIGTFAAYTLLKLR